MTRDEILTTMRRFVATEPYHLHPEMSGLWTAKGCLVAANVYAAAICSLDAISATEGEFPPSGGGLAAKVFGVVPPMLPMTHNEESLADIIAEDPAAISPEVYPILRDLGITTVWTPDQDSFDRVACCQIGPITILFIDQRKMIEGVES